MGIYRHKNIFTNGYGNVLYSQGVSLYAASKLLIFVSSLVCMFKPKYLYANCPLLSSYAAMFRDNLSGPVSGRWDQ